jgi:dihydroorotase
LSALLEGLDWRRADAAGSTGRAERFGLGKRKGRLAIGHDADLVVLDPGRSHSVRNADQLSKAKYTLFDGMNVPFLIEAVMLRGNTVYSDGLVNETPVGVVL